MGKEVGDVLQREKYDKNYQVNFGSNYFPEKEYKGVKYEEGYYEFLLVTLGEGKGDNWWCVLFPPLCLIEADESTDVEYKSIVKELIDKYL
ncbi:MAG: stage II sporulation protein R [Bacilli bacterium]